MILNNKLQKRSNVESNSEKLLAKLWEILPHKFIKYLFTKWAIPNMDYTTHDLHWYKKKTDCCEIQINASINDIYKNTMT